MIKAEVVEPAATKWAPTIVLVPKTDGCLGFCVEYRRPDTVTERDRYPISKMHEVIDSLVKSQVFSTLDANSSYWQIEIDDKDVNKAAYVTNNGLFCYTTMPFWIEERPGNVLKSDRSDTRIRKMEIRHRVYR